MNTASSNHRWSPGEMQALEARFGLRVAAHLEGQAEALPHEIRERLRVARLQAVARARGAASAVVAPQPLQSPAVQIAHIDAGGSVLLLGQGDDREEAWWMRLGILLPLLVLVAGLIGIDWWHTHEQIQAVAEIDAALLGDDLPPAAYADPGFTEFVAANPVPVIAVRGEDPGIQE